MESKFIGFIYVTQVEEIHRNNIIRSIYTKYLNLCQTCQTVQSLISNLISNWNFLKEEIVRFNLWITANFYLTSLKNLIYEYFELTIAWKGFDLVELQINFVQINCSVRWKDRKSTKI